MRTKVDPRAAADARAIRRWMATNHPAWESAFADEYRAARDFLKRYPRSGPQVAEGIRRKQFANAPFALYYRIEQDGQVSVLAVGHLGRDENWWRGR